MFNVSHTHNEETGASAAEYSLLVAGIAAVVVTAILILGGTVGGLFDDTCEEFAAQPAIQADC